MLKPYDYECQGCRKIFEAYAMQDELEIVCPTCSGKAKRIWIKFPGKDWFKPFTTEEFEPYYGGPIKIESKQQLKDLCLKHNVTNRALGDIRNITEV